MKCLPVLLSLLVISLPSLAGEPPVHSIPQPFYFLNPTVAPDEPDQQTVVPAPLVEPRPVVHPDDGATATADTPASNSANGSCRSRSSGKPQAFWYAHAKTYLEDTHWGHHEFFLERPFGSQIEVTLQTQIANGSVDQMVLYQYDFLEGRAELNPRGWEQLAKIRCWMEQTGRPVVIEPLSDPRRFDAELAANRRQAIGVAVDQLNQARKMHVAAALGLPPGDESVVIGRPAAFGLLRGGAIGARSEAESNIYNLLRDSADQGKTRLSTGGGSLISPGVTGN
jgi:hypothetical protein